VVVSKGIVSARYNVSDAGCVMPPERFVTRLPQKKKADPEGPAFVMLQRKERGDCRPSRRRA
jgi:hypothetical protein